MRKLLLISLALIIGTALWYQSWNAAMKPHVARINQSITHYNQQFKTSNYRATFKSESVRASGFPFAHMVVIDKPNLAMVWGQETYAVETECIELHFEDAGQGRYRLVLPDAIHALYAEAGKAPEAYKVNVENSPTLWARVMDTSSFCKGESCQAKPDAVLSEIGFQPNGDITLDASLGDKTQKIGFPIMALPKPLFMPIPNDPSRPVSLFVGMLREALVFNTKP